MRVSWDRSKVPGAVREERDQYIEWLKGPAARHCAQVREVTIEEPEPARIHGSVDCVRCGEAVMETRTRTVGGDTVCITCAEDILDG